MNSKIRIVLAGVACAAGCALALADGPGSFAGNRSPAVDVQAAGPAPSQAYVWMSGHWNSEASQWKWVSAHWELPPSRSATWVGGHWVSSGGNWVWMNGAWNIGDEQQAQAGPPQPPGQYAAAAQGVPTPSTAAPYVDGQYQGQYGPGGVARAVDQPAGTTDYGPVDYSAAYYPAYGYPGYAYPGYGFVGDPFYWGLPAVALGFGWGPGFRGWGRGGFAHGGGFFGRAGFAHGGGGGHFGR